MPRDVPVRSGGRLRVAAYGPDPEAAYRTGGVASWMGYLRHIGRVADVEIRFHYVDASFFQWTAVPKSLCIAVGALTAALKVLLQGRDRIDVLHVNSSLYRRVAFRDAPVVLAARLRRVPVVLQIHGGRLENLEHAPVSRRLWGRLFRYAACLGVHPGPQWREFREAGYRGKMTRVYNVVPSTDVSADTAADQVEFLFLGRVAAEKGIEELLEAFLQLRETGYESTRLTIAGEGPLSCRVRETVEQSSHSEAVSIVGYVSGDELDRVLRTPNVFVLPSRHQEGFPFSFLEAGERGMACLATENSAISEVFEPGEDFLPLDMAREGDLYEKMGRVADDKEMRVALGEAIEDAVASCCTVEGSAERFAVLYRDVAGSMGEP